MWVKRPLLLALSISVIGHIAFAFLFPVPDTEHRIARFDVELVPPAPIPEALESAPELTEAPEPEPSVETEVPVTPISPDIPATPEPTEAVRSEKEARPAVPTTVLNLSRPADWDQIVNELPTPTTGLPFNPALGEAVRQREQARRRSLYVASRQADIYGVADEDYARTGVLGQELKREGGCVTLREDKGVEEGQRWWASQCTETRQNPFTLPPVEYDALGRAVVD